VIVHSFFPLFLPLTVCLQVKLSEQGVVVPSVRVHFQIVNFTKPDSLFNLGMRPVLYSMSDSVNKGMGWVRGGTDISYCASSLSRVNASAGEGSAVYYTLSFTIEFAQPKDTVFIAYSYPYTLTDYRLDVASILQRPGAESLIRRAKLCSTVGGEDCDLLVITDFSTERERVGNIVLPDSNEVVFAVNEDAVSGGNVSGKAFGNSIKSSAASLKPALFFSGRVHPGETPASWMMKGMLDFLTSTSPGAKLLRQSFVIFVVPILNPDGVLFGNNRCSLAGVDLNRQWKTPSKMMHPTVFALKNFMMAQRKVRDVAMYIDLHGHSRKYNVFMYGCDDKKKPRPQVRGFPRLLSQHPIGGKYLCFEDCSFHVKKGRESTARVVVSKEMNIPYSFTLEATFCGANFGPLKNCHMNTGHLQEMGAALCDAVLQFMQFAGVVKEYADPVSEAICDKVLKKENMVTRSVDQNDDDDDMESICTVADDVSEIVDECCMDHEIDSDSDQDNRGSSAETTQTERLVSTPPSSASTESSLSTLAFQGTKTFSTNYATNYTNIDLTSFRKDVPTTVSAQVRMAKLSASDVKVIGHGFGNGSLSSIVTTDEPSSATNQLSPSRRYYASEYEKSQNLCRTERNSNNSRPNQRLMEVTVDNDDK
jgi:cytosolic carboxypeptidase protein 2/3